jgi:hypothetical protein
MACQPMTRAAFAKLNFDKKNRQNDEAKQVSNKKQSNLEKG